MRWTQWSKNTQAAQDLRVIQEASCGICGAGTVTLVLDHDHRTREVRGWLCYSCNSWLGHHLDKKGLEFLKAALDYLKEPPIKFLGTHPLLTERYLKCGRCHVEKSYQDFYRYRKGGVVRFSGYCKPCQASYMKSRKGRSK